MGEMKLSKGDSDGSSYVQIDKTQVLQEAKQCFMATSVKTRKLVDILTKCIFVMLRGDKLTNTEATDLFFHITRLFQYKDKDNTLRRLTYIGIKALSQQAENVYVVTSSLTTDVNSSRDDPAVRASALRALCQISDASTFTTIERYLKQSIVDKHPVVASAALTSLIRIANVNPEIVRRCTNEIQEALNSDSPMVQYHALALRYQACKNDRLATNRLLSTCVNQGLKSPLAICLLLRIFSSYINESTSSEDTKLYTSYIRDCLNHRSEMVEYEAANTIVSITTVTSKIFKNRIPAVVIHLRNFLSASKPALKFAAVRSLNSLAAIAPAEVRECNLDLEQLISQSDSNRSIASLAITTLLKTGLESTVDKFLKQIGSFLSEIDDGFKVAVVSSVGQLCEKYPAKHSTMMDFLFNMLRDEGGFAYKEAIVDTIITIIENNAETKEKGLEILCEFIEDCDHEDLAIKALCMIGREGPKTEKPRKYFRTLTRCIQLERVDVSSAAIRVLAKFSKVPQLTDDIRILLQQAMWHDDFGVMDEAIFYGGILSAEQPELVDKCMADICDIDYSDLEIKLMDHLKGDCEQPFENIPRREERVATIAEVLESAPVAPETVFTDIDLGPLIETTQAKPLTDRDVSELVVTCTQHIHLKHIVFRFDCRNTVDSMHLENVRIEMEAPPGFNILASTEHPKLAFEETVSLYACVELVDEACCEMNYFTNLSLKFDLRNVNPDTKEIDDEINEEVFPLEDMLIDLSELLTDEHIRSLGWEIERE